MRKIEDTVLVVDIDGVLVAIAGYGSESEVVIQSDDKALVKEVKTAANEKRQVQLTPYSATVTAGWESSLNLLAALLAVKPGRAYIKEAPPEILQQIV